jgi:hypothetical protein
MAALGNSCLSISHPLAERDWFVTDKAMVGRLFGVGAGVFIALNVIVKVMVRF